jgi:hypothetical protein
MKVASMRIPKLAAERSAGNRQLHDEASGLGGLDEPILYAVPPKSELDVARSRAIPSVNDARARTDGWDSDTVPDRRANDEVGKELLLCSIRSNGPADTEGARGRILHNETIGGVDRVERHETLEGRRGGGERVVVEECVWSPSVRVRDVGRRTGGVEGMPLQRSDASEPRFALAEGPPRVRRRHEPARCLESGMQVSVERHSKREIVPRIRENRLVENRGGLRAKGGCRA